MSENYQEIPNGLGAAAILSAGVGCFLVGLFFLAEDASPTIAHFFNFYPPAGALSGVSTVAVAVWLLLWFVLARTWRHKTIKMWPVNLLAFFLLAASLLLTFPPFVDLIQGK